MFQNILDAVFIAENALGLVVLVIAKKFLGKVRNPMSATPADISKIGEAMGSLYTIPEGLEDV